MTTTLIFAVALYKIVSLLIGLASIYMGYRLFQSSVWGSAGEVDAAFNDSKLLIRKAAPGTFFALFGTFVISVTLYMGLEFEIVMPPSSEKLGAQQKISPPSVADLPDEVPINIWSKQ